jgi:uncharacterized cupin superfamily protein
MTSWLEPLGRTRRLRAGARGAVPPRAPAKDGRPGRSTTEGAVRSPNAEIAGPGKAPVSVATRRFHAIFAAMNASIVRLDTPLEPDVSVPGADRLLAGAPEHRVWNYFTDTTQTFFAGRWSGTRGKWRVRYTENELCVLTAGRVVITSDTGESSAFGPGDAFVVPAGFSGSWEVLEDCAKVYAIFEPRT